MEFLNFYLWLFSSCCILHKQWQLSLSSTHKEALDNMKFNILLCATFYTSLNCTHFGLDINNTLLCDTRIKSLLSIMYTWQCMHSYNWLWLYARTWRRKMCKSRGYSISPMIVKKKFWQSPGSPGPLLPLTEYMRACNMNLKT